MAFKCYNTLIINYRSQNLPRNWRARVEQVVASVGAGFDLNITSVKACLLYTSPSPRDGLLSRMPSSA